ncbi:MAG TPA: Sir2 family NAD-dependent protein deacetylase [Euzebya sp.]|nr:Sir2 family NAD-dependent protein deacetylase [Euzebya sp.]
MPDALAQLLRRSRSVVVFTGAGISTESGIPDYRGPRGLWTRNDPREMTFDRYVQFPEVRARSWSMRREFLATGAAPNPAHTAIAELERAGRCPGVITQNIDGLHTAAGSATVVEIHGTARKVGCIGRQPRGGRPDGCGFRADAAWALQQLDEGDPDPMCPRCGGLVKSATISFGQAMDNDALEAASRLIERADAMLVVGSSLVVRPAADLPAVAAERGLPLAILNAEPTPLDHLADVVVHDRAGRVLPAAVRAALAPG